MFQKMCTSDNTTDWGLNQHRIGGGGINVMIALCPYKMQPRAPFSGDGIRNGWLLWRKTALLEGRSSGLNVTPFSDTAHLHFNEFTAN
jgi:hypothetical protein